MRKRVKAVIEKGINYIFHLQAIARLNFDSKYADRYEGSVKRSDIDYLRQIAPLLRFGDCGAGNLVYLLTFSRVT